MQKFTRNLLTEWRKLGLPLQNGVLVTAISGGADSVSLVLALNELKQLKKLDCRTVLAHFNHNLRGSESDQDENFVKNLASQLNFELVLGNARDLPETGNLEQNARVVRYEFLLETVEKLNAEALLTAHTMNDQAETFLINLIRGSGIDGLTGIKPIRNLDLKILNLIVEKSSACSDIAENELAKTGSQLVRPLINWAKREDTENFCRSNKVEFRNDSMNEDLAFSRVRIRKILLPMLKEFNPKIVETIAKTARLLREDAEFLEAKKSVELRNNIYLSEDEHSKTLKKEDLYADKSQSNKFQQDLFLKDLKDIFPSMRRMILREWLKSNRGNLRRLELKHIEAIENLIFTRKSGRIIELPGGATIIKKNGKLTFQKSKVEKC